MRRGSAWWVKVNSSTSSGNWPGTSGGPGSRTSSACSASSTRRSGGRPTTTRSSSSSGSRPSSSSGGRPRWRSTRGSTTPSAGWPNTSRTPTPGARSTPSSLRSRPVAYFSAEFGLHESLPIYSGGLGVLAGDHLKSASDLGIPLVGIGLLYDQGYFRQTLDADGWQQEHYLNANPDLLPIERGARPPTASRCMIAIETRAGVLQARVWRVEVGRTTLLLLDSNVPENTETRPGADRPALRRRRPGPDPPGAAPGRRRRPGPARAGHPPVGAPPQRGAQRLRRRWR